MQLLSDAGDKEAPSTDESGAVKSSRGPSGFRSKGLSNRSIRCILTSRAYEVKAERWKYVSSRGSFAHHTCFLEEFGTCQNPSKSMCPCFVSYLQKQYAPHDRHITSRYVTPRISAIFLVPDSRACLPDQGFLARKRTFQPRQTHGSGHVS